MKSEITNKVSNFNVLATNKNSFAQDFSLTQRSHPSVEEVKTAEKLAKSKKRAINDTEKTADVPLGGNRSLQVTSWCEYNNEADAQDNVLSKPPWHNTLGFKVPSFQIREICCFSSFRI